MKIGIFGGTFDPPHVGHLILAAEARYQLGLNRLLWVLTPNPPHKPGQEISPLAARLDLVGLAIDENPAFELSRLEIDRPAPHYALDTVQLLRGEYPASELTYIMGGDSLRDLPTWHRAADLVAACDFLGVMRRPGDEVDLPGLEKTLPGLAARVRFIEAPLLEISASQIRQRIAARRPFRYYLTLPVYGYILANDLYAENGEN